MRKDLYLTAREFIIYGLGSTLMQAASVLLIPIYTRWLGLNDYGVLALLTGLQAMLIILAQGGLGSALFRSYYDYHDELGQRDVISTTTWLLMMVTTAVAGSAFLLSDIMVGILGLDSLMGASVRLIALITFFEGLNILPFSVFRARRQALRYASTSLIVLVVRLSAIIYFVVVHLAGLQGVLYGMLVGAGFSFVVGYVQVIGSVSFRVERSEIKKLLRFGVPLIPANLAGWILAVSGRYFLAHFATMSDVGIYALADRFASVLSVLLVQPLFLLWLPVMLSIYQKEYARRFYARMLIYFVIGGMFLSLGLSLFAREALALLATQHFMPARHYVFPLCLAAVVNGASRLLNVGTDLARKSENNAAAIVVAVIVFIGLNMVLTPIWGIGGMVAAMCAAYAVMSGLIFVFAYRLYPIHYEWSQVFTVLALAAAIYAVSLLLETTIPLSLLLVIVLKVGLLGSFPVALLSLGIINGQERAEARRQWSRLVSLVRARRMT
jgi:O-antigen/teichoic acid export membrane protein